MANQGAAYSPDQKKSGYFSGTAVYRKTINIPDEILPGTSGERLILSLGDVKDMASVTIKTVGCFKFFTVDSPLLPSGLIGPVALTLLTP